MLNQLVKEIQDKYGEWLEMAGPHGPLLLNQILMHMIIKERMESGQYKNFKREVEQPRGVNE